ncbi:MAG TPA: homoserine dehydrogenase, partial [Elusimicrobiota bacterium]|nr:homoserine dehydrogenase [Elusimicrobiota bacterium]
VLESKAGAKMRLLWTCDKYGKPVPPRGVQKPRFTRDWRDVVNDPHVDIVVELIGGYEPARTLVLAALKSRKHVATANKALLAKYWGEMSVAAQQSGALLYFEAAVGGGIPVIQGINEGLAANRIEKIYGILNGTTNYILGRMTEDGMDFAAALKGAQEAGFAEADPTFDIEGIDAAHKLAVLASLASGAWIRLEDVTREGISSLDVWDVHFARERLGMVTKLLGIVELGKDRFSARVHPTLIPGTHPFANVPREYNAIFVHGDAAGDVMFYGKGAGQMAASSAVVSDVIYLARQVANGTAGQIPYVTYNPAVQLKPIPFDQLQCRHYLRFTTVDRPGVLAQITRFLARQKVSISSVHQEDTESALGAAVRGGVPIVVLTHKAPEGRVREAARNIDRLAVVRRKTVHLRIEDSF